MIFAPNQAPSCVLPCEWEEQTAVDPTDLKEFEELQQTNQLNEE